EQVDQRRLAGAVMADQPQALADADRKVDIGERAHRAEAFRHAGEADDLLGGLEHGLPVVSYFAAPMTFWASSSVYSTLATPPASVFLRFSSRLPWSMRRNGTVRSLGTSLPSRICCATQKASVETPGAIETDMVS